MLKAAQIQGPRKDGSATRFKDRGAARAGADARERQRAREDRARGQRAARVPRRPRARACHRRDAERGLSRGQRGRAGAPSTIAWSAARPAPRSAASSDSGTFLMLSDSEAESGGRDKETILADAVRGGARRHLSRGGLRQGARRRAPTVGAPARAAPARPPPMPSRRCRNGRRARASALPHYVEVDRKGPDHAPLFTSEVRIKGTQPARGEGASKRAAEQAAATRASRRAKASWKRAPMAETASDPKPKMPGRAAASSPSSARRTPASRRSSTRWSAPRSRSSSARCRRRACRCAASPSRAQSQLVFIDTPGIFAPKRRLDRAMVEAAWGGAGDADIVVLIVDAAKGRRRGRRSAFSTSSRSRRIAPRCWCSTRSTG